MSNDKNLTVSKTTTKQTKCELCHDEMPVEE